MFSIENKRKVCKTPNCNKLVIYRNGLPTSKYCPNCYYKRIYKKSSIERAHKKPPKSPKIRTERQRAIDRADEWCSRWVRIKHCFVNGQVVYCRCYTCQMPHRIKNIDCGHWINREIMPTRWDLDNLRPQDDYCNRHKSGRHHQFEQNLIKEIGQDAINVLKEKANQIANFSVAEIREIAKTFHISVRLKEKEMDIKVWK